MHEGERYDRAEVSPAYQYWDFEDDEDDDSTSASHHQQDEDSGNANILKHMAIGPRDSFTGYRLHWQVGDSKNALTLAVAAKGFSSLPGRNPMSVLVAAAESLFIDCQHDRMAKFTTRHGSLYETTPPNPITPRSWRRCSLPKRGLRSRTPLDKPELPVSDAD